MEKIYVVVDENETEYKTKFKPQRMCGNWIFPENEEINFSKVEVLEKGSIEKLIGKKLTWEDEPVELKEKLIETNQRGV